MYCSKCHKHSPDNFISCAYCGAKLKSPQKNEFHKSVKNRDAERRFSSRLLLRILIAVGLLLVVAAVSVAVIWGSKPEKAVKQFVNAIENADEKAYYSLYDDNIVRYKTENHYFGEEETYDQMIMPLQKSVEFYESVCGEGYELQYSINKDVSLGDEELESFNSLLEDGFGYMEFPSQVNILEVEVVANGENGEYKSVYSEFWCMKIKGIWYVVDKTVVADYNKMKADT